MLSLPFLKKGGETRGRRQMCTMWYSRVTRREVLRKLWRTACGRYTTCRGETRGRRQMCTMRHFSSTRGQVLRKLWRTTSCRYTTSSRPSCRGTRFCVRSTTGASALLRTGRPSAVSGRRYSLCRDTHRCNNRRDHIYNTGLAFDAICFEFYNWDLCDSSDRSHHLSSVFHTASRALWADCGYDASPDKSSQRGGLLSD